MPEEIAEAVIAPGNRIDLFLGTSQGSMALFEASAGHSGMMGAVEVR